MLFIVAVMELTSVATADPVTQPRLAGGATETLLVGSNGFTLLTNLEVGYRLAGYYWIDVSLGFGAAEPSDPYALEADSAYEARAGLGWIRYYQVSSFGAVASAGWTHRRLYFGDGLVEPRHWTEKDDVIFAEIRGVARARVTRFAALELAAGPRSELALRGQGSVVALVGGMGIYATF